MTVKILCLNDESRELLLVLLMLNRDTLNKNFGDRLRQTTNGKKADVRLARELELTKALIRELAEEDL